jgi:hypothetical protein
MQVFAAKAETGAIISKHKYDFFKLNIGNSLLDLNVQQVRRDRATKAATRDIR